MLAGIARGRQRPPTQGKLAARIAKSGRKALPRGMRRAPARGMVDRLHVVGESRSGADVYSEPGVKDAVGIAAAAAMAKAKAEGYGASHRRHRGTPGH